MPRWKSLWKTWRQTDSFCGQLVSEERRPRSELCACMKDNIIIIFSQLCLSERKPVAFALWTLISSISPSPDSSWWWIMLPVVLNIAQLKETEQKLCVCFLSFFRLEPLSSVCVFLLTIRTVLCLAYFTKYLHWITHFGVKFILKQKEQWASTTWYVLSQAMQLITFWVRFAAGVNLYNPWLVSLDDLQIHF